MSGPLVAGTDDDRLPLEDVREPVRVLIASLALGGAERIVVEWLAAEVAAGRACELAVLNMRRPSLSVPAAVSLRIRDTQSPQAFVHALGERWACAHAPVSTHLIGDDLLELLWRAGVRTVPVAHNAAQGWRNRPETWQAGQVPQAVACAQAVAEEMRTHGCRVPVLSLCHRPQVAAAATDAAERARVREEGGIAPGTFVMLAVGAIKPQKNYARAVDVLAALAPMRDVVLVIAGGVLDATGLRELDEVVDRALAMGVSDRLRLPGFVDPVAPWFAAADVLLNTSRFEGLSMAVREALAAGLPVVATDVGGQRESADEHLTLLPPDASAAQFAAKLAALPVRETLGTLPSSLPARLPRAWSMTLAAHRPGPAQVQTLMVTANLNAGGAQRSLINLCVPLSASHRIAVAVVAQSTQRVFVQALQQGGVHAFRCSRSPDPLAAAESVLAWAARHGARNLCFWNVDARVKLLVAKFAPPHLRLLDVSPGDYAFEEMQAALPWAQAIGMTADDYHARLDELVVKYEAPGALPCARSQVIVNGVPPGPLRSDLPAQPRFLVSGRIAPSKRLMTIVDAFAHLSPLHPGAELVIAGSAEPRDAVHAQAIVERARGLRVTFRGAQADLQHLAEPFTAAVVLGIHQGSPNAVLEAMAAGLPVIANASGGTGSMVRDGRTGWLLAEDCDAGALAAAMHDAIADRSRNERLGRAARDFVLREHSIMRMVERYRRLFDAVEEAGAVP